MKTIYVYQDYVHNNGALFRRLQDTAGAERVAHCDANDIINGCLDPKTVAMFVMPGGADLFYCEKLNGAGNAAIRAYVEMGGTYLGICAGAYYACTRIEWAQDAGHQAIIGDRELNFFKGTAIGPIYDLLEDKDITSSWENAVTLQTSSGNAAAFYKAGPVFIADEDSQHETLANYDLEGTPPALVSVKIGEGRAVLSSCHIEYTPAHLQGAYYAHLNSSQEWTKAVCDKFARLWTPETDLWNKFIPALLDQKISKAA